MMTVVFLRRASLAWALVCAATSLLACPQNITVAWRDGGAGPDGNTAGDAGGGSDSGLPTDDGGSGQDAGNPGQDAGGTDGGGTTTLTWGNMITAIAEDLYAVGGSSGTDVYVGSAVGYLQHYDGTSAWTNVYHEPSNFDLHSIWVDPSTREVFAGSQGSLIHCSPPCLAQTAFTTQSSFWINGVCGTSSPQQVYAVGYDQSAGNNYFYQWNSGTWNLLITNPGPNALAACWVDPSSGAVYIAAQSQVTRFASGTFVQETVDDYANTSLWPTSEVANQYFNAVWGSGTTVFAAGYRRRVMSRQSNGHWTYLGTGFNPSGVDNFNALAGWTSAEVYAAGMGDVSGEQAALFNGSAWAFIPSDIDPGVNIFGMWAAGPNEYFAVGNDNSSNYYILHGTR